MDQGHHLHHQQLHHQYSAAAVSADGGGGDRFPQWSIQETRDFLMIRAELDPNFMETKRNKLLWEVISTRMKEKGYSRSAEQCKCKWKNLVTRYKGCETMETEAMRQQFPFYNELQTIFTTRMQRMLWLEAEGSGSAATTSKKKAATQFSSDEDDENEESEGGGGGGVPKKKRKVKGGNTTNANPNSNSVVGGIREMMEEFMKQQMQIEMQWMKAYEAREEERRIKEMEWRQTMEALENERMMMEKRWREREEQRKMREEARAEKRDALITALLNKLRREDNMLSTCDNLEKIGIHIDPLCCICEKDVESINHLFFACEFSTKIWISVTAWGGVSKPAKSWHDEKVFLLTQCGSNLRRQKMYMMLLTIYCGLSSLEGEKQEKISRYCDD